jgi:membrane protease subunit HflK
MPWNDNANSGQKPGPWGAPPPSGGQGGSGGSDGGGPGGRGPGGAGGPKRPKRPAGGGPPPPDLGEFGRQLRSWLERLLGGPSGKGVQGQTLAIVAGVAFALWLLSGVYMVQPNEEAVVTTFGRYTAVSGPGLHVRLPWPIQSQKKVPVTDAQRIEIGGREGAEEPKESLMLTGDENIVDVNFTVLWRISDPAKYLFRLEDQEGTIRAVGESAMREVVGRTALDPILTNGRAKLQDDTRNLMQRVLDSYDSGVLIQEVQVRNASPPPGEVADAFRDVTSAKQEAEATANQAGATRAQIVQQALGYKAQVVQEAQGEAARFNQVYAQYKAAPGVTRQRLYIETMERVLKNTKKVIVDSKGAQAPIILPPEAFRPRSADQPSSPSSASPGAGR